MTSSTTAAKDGVFRHPDGRALAYTDAGDPDGAPVLVFHGVPGSRRLGLEGWATDPGAEGLRFIAMDRPGIGGSDPQRRRTLLDWPSDVASLADSLGIERFSVYGASGGGPYVLACAVAIPMRLRSAIVVNGLAPFDLKGAKRGLSKSARAAWWLFGHGPGMPRMAAKAQARMVRKSPTALPPRMARRMSEVDRRSLADEAVGVGIGQQLAEAFRQGPNGVAQDLSVLSRPWGFDLSEITMPVHLWQGTADRNVPESMGRAMAATIPDCRAHFLKEAGHLLERRHIADILAPARG